PPDGAENAFETLKLQYFEEAHGAAVELSRIVSRPLIDLPPEEFDAEYDKLMGAILTQRNIAWMDRILAATDETVLIAVGAGHLSGEYGLLNLLAAEGYALNREAF
ncbi:MAG: TraB/GumN family protein, partial [Pseudomonadota bacterium]